MHSLYQIYLIYLDISDLHSLLKLAGIFRKITDVWGDGHCSIKLETDGAGSHPVGVKSLG